jgi:hypothetical protein
MGRMGKKREEYKSGEPGEIREEKKGHTHTHTGVLEDQTKKKKKKKGDKVFSRRRG